MKRDFTLKPRLAVEQVQLTPSVLLADTIIPQVSTASACTSKSAFRSNIPPSVCHAVSSFAGLAASRDATWPRPPTHAEPSAKGIDICRNALEGFPGSPIAHSLRLTSRSFAYKYKRDETASHRAEPTQVRKLPVHADLCQNTGRPSCSQGLILPLRPCWPGDQAAVSLGYLSLRATPAYSGP